MSLVFVDSSIWIEYFRGSKNINLDFFNELIDNNQICINDLILAELIPSLQLRKEYDIIEILRNITKIPLAIDWNGLIELQTVNLKHGLNNIGIPDLIIIQNVLQNNLYLYSLDRHFEMMSKYHKLKIHA